MLLVAAALALAGCGGSPDGGRQASGAELDRPPMPPSGELSAVVDNPYLPMRPGARWVYVETSSEGTQRDVVVVTRQTKVVDGVTARVVRDTATDENGKVAEDTFDWYAQDASGNVWYLGEDTTAYENGKVSTEGSWQAGVGGAEAGIVMPAHPRPGMAYVQEHDEGIAEDQAEVVGLGRTVTVPFGRYAGVLETSETSPLEPGLVEQKYYAKGVGVVLERTVSGGDDVARLVATTPGR
jgi:hypothetical protein